MISTRVGIQIREALLGSKSSNENKDLALMAKKFELYKTKLNALVKALQAQHIAMKQLNESRLLVAECLSEIAKQSPLSEYAGVKRTSEGAQNLDEFVPVEGDKHFESDPNTLFNSHASFYSTHQAVFARRQMYEQSFHDFVLQYVIDWEETVLGRIVASLDKAETLRLEVDYYHEKMKSLTTSTHDWSSILLAKSSDEIKARDQERINRNKIKYQDARNAYAQHAKDLRLLIEEVTDRGWRDLFPVLMKLSLFDSSLASDENQLLSELIDITKGMNDVANRYGLKPDPRIKELGTDDPNNLSTRSLELSGDEKSGISRLHLDADGDDVSETSSGVDDNLSNASSVQDQNKKSSSILKPPPSISDDHEGSNVKVTPEKRVTFAIDETPRACGSRRLAI